MFVVLIVDFVSKSSIEKFFTLLNPFNVLPRINNFSVDILLDA